MRCAYLTPFLRVNSGKYALIPTGFGITVTANGTDLASKDAEKAAVRTAGGMSDGGDAS